MLYYESQREYIKADNHDLVLHLYNSKVSFQAI